MSHSAELLAANERLLALRAALRAARGESPRPEQRPIPFFEPPPPPEPEPEPTITLYPTLALAILKQHKEAPGRVWLLLRWLDKPGRGATPLAEARRQLTDSHSPYRICGRRQLQNLLRAGGGLFWQVAGGHIWLGSLLKVSGRVGVERFLDHPVELPVAALLGPMAGVRAHLYATFHSGRDGDEVDEQGRCKPGRPIARATLQRLSGVSRSSQRRYERRTKTRTVTNYAVGEGASPENVEKRSSLQGNATFRLRDYAGRQGRQGQEYLAWQLPNSYSGPHSRRPGGQRQQQLNRELADLRRERNVGNGRLAKKRYFGRGKEAGKAYNRDSTRDYLWPGRGTRRGGQMWWCVSGRKSLTPILGKEIIF